MQVDSGLPGVLIAACFIILGLVSIPLQYQSFWSRAGWCGQSPSCRVSLTRADKLWSRYNGSIEIFNSYGAGAAHLDSGRTSAARTIVQSTCFPTDVFIFALFPLIW